MIFETNILFNVLYSSTQLFFGHYAYDNYDEHGQKSHWSHTLQAQVPICGGLMVIPRGVYLVMILRQIA